MIPIKFSSFTTYSFNLYSISWKPGNVGLRASLVHCELQSSSFYPEKEF